MNERSILERFTAYRGGRPAIDAAALERSAMLRRLNSIPKVAAVRQAGEQAGLTAQEISEEVTLALAEELKRMHEEYLKLYATLPTQNYFIPKFPG